MKLSELKVGDRFERETYTYRVTWVDDLYKNFCEAVSEGVGCLLIFGGTDKIEVTPLPPAPPAE